MTEKRFTIHKEDEYKEEWYGYPFCIKENGKVVFETIPLGIAEEVRDKLNEKEEIIEDLKSIVKYLIFKDILYSNESLDYMVEEGLYSKEEIDNTKRDQAWITDKLLKYGIVKPEDIVDDFREYLE